MGSTPTRFRHSRQCQKGSQRHRDRVLGFSNVQQEELIRLIERFPRAFPADPPGAFRDFLRVEERLRRDGDDAGVRSLSDALWVLAPEIPFGSDEARAAFFHDLARFFASPGPAFDEERAREAMEVPRMIREKKQDGLG